MALSADQFAKAVINAGLSSAEEIKSLWAALPSGSRPKDGESFAKVLVEQRKLTPFQAAELLSGGPTPLVVGDYELLAKIGAGGMGQVFKARHRHLERLAAIKLLPAAMTKNDEAIRRFQREVKAAAKLSHPNIVQAYDAGVQRGIWYLVMEYVEGRDLAAVSAETGPLPIDRAVDYVRQTAQGLAFAHDSGVVHRDIKPANLLLDKKGNIKILDMGLARFDDATAAKDGLTQSGQVMGTVDYMAPEQAFDTRLADARADIYSLGCTLFRLLTGMNLFDGDTIVQKLIAHQQQPVPDLAQRRADAPRELDLIFRKMVAKHPEDRYQTMTELDAALAAFQTLGGGHSSPSVPDGTNKLSKSSRTFPGSNQVSPSNAAGVATLGPTYATDLATQGDAPTTAIEGPHQATDPVSPQFVQIVRDRTRTRAKAKQLPVWRQPSWLLAGGLGGALLVLLGVWVIIRDKDGNEVSRIKVPRGGKVEVVPDQAATKPNKSSAAKRSPEAKTSTDNSAVTRVNTVKSLAALAEVGEFGLQFGPMQDSAVTTEPLPNPTDLPCTFEVWCKLKEVAPSGACFLYNSAWGSLRIVEEELRFYTFHGDVRAIVRPFPVNQRIHLAGVNDGVRRLLFLNGKLIATLNDAGGLNQMPEPPVPFLLGGGGETWLRGEIYAARVSSIARYTSDFTPPTQFKPDKVTELLFDFHEGTGEKLSDLSGHNRHGKIVNATWVKTGAGPNLLANDRRAAQTLYPKYAALKLRLKAGGEKVLPREPPQALPSEPFELIELDFNSTMPPPGFTTETLLPALQGLRSLESISYFWEGSVTTEELSRLVECSFADQLKEFNVGACDLNAENLDLLRKFTKLERIGLRAAHPTAELLNRLNQEHPGLRFLGLAGLATVAKPDELALKALAAMPIEELHMHGNGRIDARTCEAIANLPNLKRLTIMTVTLDDEAAAPLSRCPKLEVLKLDFTRVTDQMLLSFDSLKNLKLLHVFGAKITDEGAKQFAQRNPKCQVVTATMTIEPSR